MEKPVSVSISKAAYLLSVSPSTVTRWANEGKLVVTYTAGGQRRIPMTEVERLLNSPPEDRAERAKRQTQAAREARAKKQGMPPKTPYTDEDALTFGDYEEEVKKPELLNAFDGYEVRLQPKIEV